MAILLKNVGGESLDFTKYAQQQKEIASKMVTYGAVGCIGGVFLGNFFAYNVFYSGVAGFLIGAAVGKYYYHSQNKTK